MTPVGFSIWCSMRLMQMGIGKSMLVGTLVPGEMATVLWCRYEGMLRRKRRRRPRRHQVDLCQMLGCELASPHSSCCRLSSHWESGQSLLSQHVRIGPLMPLGHLVALSSLAWRLVWLCWLLLLYPPARLASRALAGPSPRLGAVLTCTAPALCGAQIGPDVRSGGCSWGMSQSQRVTRTPLWSIFLTSLDSTLV